MFCVSVSFKRAPLPIRQKFAFSKEEQKEFLGELIEKRKISGGVIVSTCNRSEIYFTGKELTVVEEGLWEFKGIQKDYIKKYGMFYQGKKSVSHLFRVACGLDSMILGEDEILHQVKEAYLFADEHGYTNSELNIVFQGALNCAKISKTTTKLSGTPVSLGTLTANMAKQFVQKNAKEMNGCVLVMGATGKIGSIVVKNLLAKGIPVVGTMRKHKSSKTIFLQENDKIEWVDFEKRYDAAARATVIVSATGSPHYTMIREEFARCMNQDKAYLMIDLAVPYDIDKELGKEKNITLLDIDYFKTLSTENTNIRLGETDKAWEILQECVEEVLKKLYFRNFKRKISDRCQEPWFWKMIYYLRDSLNSDELLEVFERIYQNIG